MLALDTSSHCHLTLAHLSLEKNLKLELKVILATCHLVNEVDSKACSTSYCCHICHCASGENFWSLLYKVRHL